MSEKDVKTPENGWTVKIIDQSGATDDGLVEVVRGFVDLLHANAFARAYVRDSIERCRVPGATDREVLESWFSFGENAEVPESGDEGWKANPDLDEFVSTPATPMERDWRSIDPRRLVDEEEFIGPSNDEDDDDASRAEIIRH